MASTGNVFPGTGENNAGIGATAWTNPANVVSDNATDATCNAGASSQYLVARNYSLAIPTNAVFEGITVRIEASEHSTGTESLNGRLQDETGTLVGTSKAATISGTTKVVYTYGSTSDVWGLTSLTPAQVNDADFGVRFWFTTAHDVRVDYVTLALEYTDASSTLSDDFNRASLGSDWERVLGDTDWAINASTTARPGDDFADTAMRRTETSFPNDQFAEAKIEFESSGSNRAGVAVRMDASGDCYFARINDTGVEVWKRVGGTNTFVTDWGSTLSAGTFYTVRLAVVGTTLKLSVNGLLRATVTDSALTSGKPGLWASTNDSSGFPDLDDFLATAASGGAATRIKDVIDSTGVPKKR
jgi:hypothetical protein